MVLVFEIELINETRPIKMTLEEIIEMCPNMWRKAWIESTHFLEEPIEEIDILDVIFNIIERFCQILEDDDKFRISFIEHIGETIADWNVLLNHIKIGRAYKNRPY